MDGAEIQESVLTLYHLDRLGFDVRCFAPDRDQMHVVNHLSGEPSSETRNVRIEAARITRGNIADLKDATLEGSEALSALVLPGGFGVAKNLSSFATQGADGRVDPDLEALLISALKSKTPIVAICISPAILAMVCKRAGVSSRLTIGQDAATAEAIEKLGCEHSNCPTQEAVFDADSRVITTPAYMEDTTIGDVSAGIGRALEKLADWLG